jgi:hypothetical protein
METTVNKWNYGQEVPYDDFDVEDYFKSFEPFEFDDDENYEFNFNDDYNENYYDSDTVEYGDADDDYDLDYDEYSQ